MSKRKKPKVKSGSVKPPAQSSSTLPGNPTTQTTATPKETLETLKMRVEVQELRLKIRDLRKPEYKRPTFWFSIGATLVAVIGVVAQGTLSNLRSERADIKTERADLLVQKATQSQKEAEEKRDAAIKRSVESENVAKAAMAKAEVARQQESDIHERIRRSTPIVDKLAKGLQELEESARMAGLQPDFRAKIEALTKIAQDAREKLFQLQFSIEEPDEKSSQSGPRRVTIRSSRPGVRIWISSEFDWRLRRSAQPITEKELEKDARLLGVTDLVTFIVPGAYVIVGFDGKDWVIQRILVR